MQRKVFISYRAADTLSTASQLAADLRRTFGDAAAFLDYRNLEPAEQWPQQLQAEVGGTSVMLVLVGDGWLTAQDPYGRRRIDVDDDWVRLEVATALRAGGKVLPILINDAKPISVSAIENLPEIAALATTQARRLRDVDWESDFAGLVDWLESNGFERINHGETDGRVALEQIVVSRGGDGRFIEAIINNTSSQNVVLSKFVYSRGVSSQEMSLILICCPYCMEAWYAVQRGPVDTSTPGTRLEQAVWFVKSGDENRSFKGRLHYAQGCVGLLFTQLEMNISVVAMAKEVIKIGVFFPDEDRSKNLPEPVEARSVFETDSLLSPEDTICVYIGLGEDHLALKLCRPVSEFDERFI
jgi:hypothetical protein